MAEMRRELEIKRKMHEEDRERHDALNRLQKENERLKQRVFRAEREQVHGEICLRRKVLGMRAGEMVFDMKAEGKVHGTRPKEKVGKGIT